MREGIQELVEQIKEAAREYGQCGEDVEGDWLGNSDGTATYMVGIEGVFMMAETSKYCREHQIAPEDLLGEHPLVDKTIGIYYGLNNHELTYEILHKLDWFPARADAEEQMGWKRILVADDEASQREAIGRALKLQGVNEVNYAQSGDDVIDLASKRRYDLIVTDNNMDSSSGLYAIDQLRQAGDQTPVIFMTGDLTEEKAARARELGAEVLAKPYDPRRLRELVEQYLPTKQ